MNEILDYLDRFSKILTWQMILVFLILFARKSIMSILNSFSILLGKANKFVFDGRTLTIEQVFQKVEDQKKEISDKEREIKDLENGGIRIKPQSSRKELESRFEILKKSNIDLKGFDIDKLQRELQIESINSDGDPIKGNFGGKNAVGNLLLNARVEELPNNLYKINVSLSSTDSTKPLNGNVKYYLHPTFTPDNRLVKPEDGIAKLTLISYGSFTIGAEYEGKRLELDLAELDGVSEEFKKS